MLALLAGAAASVNASALTTTVPPNQRLCFFADVDKEGEKIGVSLGAGLSRKWRADDWFSSTLLYVFAGYCGNAFVNWGAGPKWRRF